MQRYCVKAGIVGNCHRFRHTFATQLVENGAQLLTVRDFLGHSSLMSSSGYVRVSNQKLKQEYYHSMERAMQQMGLEDVDLKPPDHDYI